MTVDVKAEDLPSNSAGQIFSGRTLAALGVVFGDIGTSPLYAVRQCFAAPHGVVLDAENILGVLSLIFWSLIVVISVKYVSVMLRADNRGEGGVLALSALVSNAAKNWKLWAPLATMGLLGAALFFGDGILTPAISVLSAVEGLSIAQPALTKYVVPITIGVLLCVFLAQKHGTGTVGGVFGPVVLIWFAAIATLGIAQLIREPQVLAALNPRHALHLFAHNGVQGFTVLSAVFLAVTGGEALYADLGHFGRLPIRNAWSCVVLPALTLNYFGQGALLLAHPDAISNPFYVMVPSWALGGMIALATAATIIASQAAISGVFSVTVQALNLGYLPRIQIRHSSAEEIGQVYVPAVNWSLFVGTVLLVLLFRSSDSLAGAYGIAVASTMLLASIMIGIREHLRGDWRWHIGVLLCVIFLVDVTFFASNLLKIVDGGWIPLAIAAALYFTMSTWHEGRRTLNWSIARAQISEREFLLSLQHEELRTVSGTAVYLVDEASTVPRSLLQSVKFFRVLHERIILLTFVATEVPRLEKSERTSVHRLAPNVFRIVSRFGFMETPNITSSLRAADELGLAYAPNETIYVAGRESVATTSRSGMPLWRKRLFALMIRNCYWAPMHFGVPIHRLLEIGTHTAI